MGEADTAKTRRLPSWMVSSSSSSSTVVDDSKKKKKESSSESSSSIIIIETEEQEPVVNQQQQRGGKRKQVGRATSASPSKKKPKTRSRRHRRRQYSSDDEEEEDPISLVEDDDDYRHIKKQKQQDEEEEHELTADDLITIAQEYVKADDTRAKQNGVTAEPNSRNTISSTSRKGKLREVRTEPDSKEQIETTSLTSRNDSGGWTEALPTSTSLDPPSNLDSMKDREHFPTGETIFSSCSTGDATQDMLNLFLGPLLSKPKTELTKQPKIELTKHETPREEIGLEKPRQMEEIVKQLPPLTKKKSSLRDKVAMFLD